MKKGVVAPKDRKPRESVENLIVQKENLEAQLDNTEGFFDRLELRIKIGGINSKIAKAADFRKY